MKKYILIAIFLCASLFSYSNTLDQNLSKVEITQAKDFSKIKGKGKKQIFIETLLPMIEKIKESIKEDKEYIETLSEKKELNEEEKIHLDEMFKKYNVKTNKINDLLHKMIIPPTSLILAQASLESGWGTSKVAKEGNNLFGMRSTLKDPSRAVKINSKNFYKKYSDIEASVEDYIVTISRHKSYSKLREAINSGKSSIYLVNHLGDYSEVQDIYAKRLAQIITKNNLQAHD